MKNVGAEWERAEQQAEQLHPFFDEHGVPEQDRLPFAHYNMQAPGNSVPEWTFDRIIRGVVPQGSYEGYDLDKVDWYGDLLIPNYRKRAGGLPALLDVAKPLAQDMYDALQTGSIVSSSGHPSLVSPIFPPRAIVEALKDAVPDIQQRSYITYGFMPMTFKYDFGKHGELSPAGIATAIGNLVVTAAVSDSNIQPEIKEWQTPRRELYKATAASTLATVGAVWNAELNGQRDIVYDVTASPARRINHPEGDLSPFVQKNVQFLNFAVYDRLLEDPKNPASLAQLYAAPRLRPATKLVLARSNIWQAETINPTFDGTAYFHEGLGDMKMRLAERRKQMAAFVAEQAHRLR